MREDLPTSILLNTILDTAQVENMEDELLYQVIMDPINSITLLQELTMATILNIKTLKHQKT